MEWLTDMEDTDVERKSRLPSQKFFYPNSIEEEKEKKNAVNSATDAEALVLTDPDADGLGVVAAVSEKHDTVDFISCGPHSRRLDVSDGIRIALENMKKDATVYIADICPDDIRKLNKLSDLVDKASKVYWWDHHEWSEGERIFVRRRVESLVLNDGEYGDASKPEERSASQIAVSELSNEGISISDTIYDAVQVISTYDCWKKTLDENGNCQYEFIDNRARPLHYYCESVEPEQFVEDIKRHGADVVHLEKAKEKIETYMDEQAEMAACALERTKWYNFNGITVCVTYGRCPHNEVADILKLDGAELIVVVKPSGGVSLRSTEDIDWVDEIAKEFGGGGHSTAASFFIAPKDDGNDDRWDTDMLDYSYHWLTNGKRTRQKVKQEIKNKVDCS